MVPGRDGKRLIVMSDKLWYVRKAMKSKDVGPQMAQQLDAYEVALVYLYGSEALDLANRLSDVDVGIVLKDPSVLHDRKRYLKLHAELYDCLQPVLLTDTRREMDVVFIQTASPVLQFEVINAGHLLFVADPVFQADYEAEVMRQYLDIRPLVEMHFRAALERAA